MSIEINPLTYLSFRRPLTELSKVTLSIRNTSKLPVAFKVKTTAPKQYTVRPNNGRLEPGEQLELIVQMQALEEEPSPDFRCKDKFLVQSISITSEREKIHKSELWSAVERTAKDQIKERKLRVQYLASLEKAISQIPEEEEEDDTPPPAYSFHPIEILNDSSSLSSSLSYFPERSLASSSSSSASASTSTLSTLTTTTTTTTTTFTSAFPTTSARPSTVGLSSSSPVIPSSVVSPGHRATTVITSTAFSSSSSSFLALTDPTILRRELEAARQDIHNLEVAIEKAQRESFTLRQPNNRTEPSSSLMSSSLTQAAVHMSRKLDQTGSLFTPKFVAYAALSGFIIGCLFF